MSTYTNVIIWVGLIPVGILSIVVAFCCVVYYKRNYLVTDIFSIALLSSLLVNCIIVMPIECGIRVNSFQPPVGLCGTLLWVFVTFRVMPVFYVLWFMIDRLVVLRPFVSVLHKESPWVGTNRSGIVWVTVLALVSAIIGAVPLMYVPGDKFTFTDSCNIVLFSVDAQFATFTTLFEMAGFTITFSLLVKLFIRTIHAQQRAGKRRWRKQNFVEQINMKAIQDPTQYVDNCKLLFAIVMSTYILNHIPHGILTMLGLLTGGNVANANIVVIWLTLIDLIVVPVVLWAPNGRYRHAVKMVVTACRSRGGANDDAEDNVFTTSIRFDPNVTVLPDNKDNGNPSAFQSGFSGSDHRDSRNANQSGDSSDTPASGEQERHFAGYSGHDNPAFNELEMDNQTYVMKSEDFDIKSKGGNTNVRQVEKTVSIESSKKSNQREVSFFQGHDNKAFDVDVIEYDQTSDNKRRDDKTSALVHEGPAYQMEPETMVSGGSNSNTLELPADFTIDPGVTYKSSDYHHDYLSDEVSTSESDHYYARDMKNSNKKRHARRKVKQKSTSSEPTGERMTSPTSSSDASGTCGDSGYSAPHHFDESVHSDATDTNEYPCDSSVDFKKRPIADGDMSKYESNQGLAPLDEVDDYIELCPPKEIIEAQQKQASLDKDTFYNTWNSRIGAVLGSSVVRSDSMSSHSTENHNPITTGENEDHKNKNYNNHLDFPVLAYDENDLPISVAKDPSSRNSTYPRALSKTGFNPYILENGSRNLLGSTQTWRRSAVVLSAVEYLKNSIEHEHVAILDNGHIHVTSESESTKTMSNHPQQNANYLKTYTTDFF